MAKIFLLTYGIDPGSGKGIERYSNDLFSKFKNKKNVEIVGNSHIPQWINDLLYIPYKLIGRGNGIFHALSPREALFLPFLKKKSIATFHDILPLTKYHYPKAGILAKIYYAIVWNIAKHVKYIVADSYLTKKELIRKLGVNPRKIVVINIGVDDKFKPRKRRKQKIATVGYLGSMALRKRVDKVVKSFKILQEKYPNLKCRLIIGGGKPKHLFSFDVERLIKMLNVKNVVISGHIPEKRLVDIYNMFDVFIYPCEYDGYCLPILEAMRCGVPVITFRNAKIPLEIARKTIRCRNMEEVADQIYKLLTNKRYRNKISHDMIEYSKKFCWKKYIQKLLKVYKKLDVNLKI
jgi:glycosyltransferase involved in cell wall biosynthesis